MMACGGRVAAEWTTWQAQAEGPRGGGVHRTVGGEGRVRRNELAHVMKQGRGRDGGGGRYIMRTAKSEG
eukprot:76556-Chlamydomonas_euryale.AAC.1